MGEFSIGSTASDSTIDQFIGGKEMAKMKMLLVDDEERFLSTTKKLLARKGYDVLTAISGIAALDILKSHNVDVVILDVKMPGMDGITTLKEIKRRFPLVEVIMLTGHATVDSAVDGLKSGATDYLMKPTDINNLIDKAEEAFEKKQRLEEKIRVAQTRRFMKSPREIIKESENP
jgi:DNA-binding NtrC family response regulator